MTEKRMRFIKASMVILSALFSSVVILWVGAQAMPNLGSWSWPYFWKSLPIALVASAAMCGAGTRLAVVSKKWSVVTSTVVLLAVCTALRVWSWPSLALVLPGSSVSFMLAIYPKAWRWVAGVSILLTAWWFGVAAYGFYDHVRPELTERGGLSIALLFAALSLLVGSSALVILFEARTSDGSGVRDEV